MITVLRKHHRWLMIVIAILAIPFVFYFNKTDFAARGATDLGKIYGQTVTRVEFQRNARLFSLARDLGMFTLLQDLTTAATSEVSIYSEWTWNRMILRHEAEQLGIRPSSSEVVKLVQTLRPFQGQNGGFDINKYNEFVNTELPSLGFNESEIEELAGDQLTLDRVRDLVGAGVQMSDVESRENYEQTYGKMDVAVVRLRSDELAKDIKISDDDIKKYYESHKATLNTEEKRKVEFVAFTMNDEQKKLTGKERIDALQKLSDRANDFTQALLDKSADFRGVATKFQVPVQATGEFTAAAPDPQLKDPQLTQQAFRLSEQEPTSDALQTPDGYSILHLLGKVDARPLTLDEAKPKIVDALKADKTRELMTSKGNQIANQLRASIAAGVPLEAAAQQAGVNLERIPPFSPVDPPGAKPDQPKPETPDLPMIKNSVGDLAPGEVSSVVPTQSGGVIPVLEKREPIDPAAYEQGRKDFDGRYLKSKRTIAFYDWLRDRRTAAGIQATAATG
jgi:hypothetical protein